MAVISKVDNPSGKGFDYIFNCPGCNVSHGFKVTGSPKWTFNGNVDKPTISPSLKVQFHDNHTGKDQVCHSFIKDGVIQFLQDCTHKLAGKFIPMEEE